MLQGADAHLGHCFVPGRCSCSGTRQSADVFHRIASRFTCGVANHSSACIRAGSVSGQVASVRAGRPACTTVRLYGSRSTDSLAREVTSALASLRGSKSLRWPAHQVAGPTGSTRADQTHRQQDNQPRNRPASLLTCNPAGRNARTSGNPPASQDGYPPADSPASDPTRPLPHRAGSTSASQHSRWPIGRTHSPMPSRHGTRKPHPPTCQTPGQPTCLPSCLPARRRLDPRGSQTPCSLLGTQASRRDGQPTCPPGNQPADRQRHPKAYPAANRPAHPLGCEHPRRLVRRPVGLRGGGGVGSFR